MFHPYLKSCYCGNYIKMFCLLKYIIINDFHELIIAANVYKSFSQSWSYYNRDFIKCIIHSQITNTTYECKVLSGYSLHENNNYTKYRKISWSSVSLIICVWLFDWLTLRYERFFVDFSGLNPQRQSNYILKATLS